MERRGRYPAEVRERAVRMVFEQQAAARVAVGGDLFDRGEDRAARRRRCGSGYGRRSVTLVRGPG